MRKGVQLQDARLLLIDDVRTTGATMNECAKILRRAGAAEVYGAVVVRARARSWQRKGGRLKRIGIENSLGRMSMSFLSKFIVFGTGAILIIYTLYLVAFTPIE
jgi:orotate phosphoribosyltransferase